ncbi:coiled-coil domain-containing protein 103 [Uranotaenia lowii]|uniref:coiled-coil domain-containing protein 103 n=1 Tax=Uranotaenia lowii TaxID=190385 RepID=UPI002479700E|nr:coiled-coil domain-containing protein 103 [Uranotaenia lowii]
MLSASDIKKLEIQCLEQVQKDVLYNLQNDAKLRAVHTSKNYDEFKAIVDAANLTPLNAQDKRNARTKNNIWNTASSN